MPGLKTIPPFPQGVPTHALLIVDYRLIEARDEDEINKLWKAATELGFWYLKNHGVEDEVDSMFEMGSETIALPLEEKLQFEEGDQGVAFGYRAAGSNVTDNRGTRDITEWLNISKDDVLAWPKVARRTYPRTIDARMQSTVKPFVEKSLAVNKVLINVLNDKLGLPEGALASLHNAHERSSCTARVIWAPPHPESEERNFVGAHTDFGSMTFLHNRLGGLQVFPPGYDQWCYVKPLPGHAICNIGDALNIFSGGILRSNIHRVVPPPKEQAQYERYSVAFFTRPNDTAVLHALTDESERIAEAVAQEPSGKYSPGVTAQEWIVRRFKTQRANNFKGLKTWDEFHGTEDKKVIEWGKY